MKKRLLAGLVGSLLMAGMPILSNATVVTFSDFSDTSDLTLNGTATTVIMPHKSGVTVKPLFYYPTTPTHIEQATYNHSLNAFSDDYSRLQYS